MRIHLRTALVLGFMGAISVLMVFPYLLAVMPSMAQRLASSAVPLKWIVVAQSAQAFVVLTLLSWIGLRVGARVGLEAPWIRERFDRDLGASNQPRRWRMAAAIGLATGVAIVLLNFVLAPLLPPALQPVPAGVERWKGLMASFYGGVTEELLMRLFVMTLLVSIMTRITGGTSNRVYVVAIVLSAIIFGAGHLPLALQIWGIGFANVFRTLLLNGIAGVAFGWLYWRFGLEHAMLAHFSTDIVLHVVAPL